MNTCRNCGNPLEQPVTGRPRVWCSERCRKAAGNGHRARERRPDDGPAVIELAVRALVNELSYPAWDPRAVMCLIALELARELDAQPASVTLSRELRLCMAHMAETPNEPPGKIDEIRARFLQRRVEMTLQHARGEEVVPEAAVDEFLGEPLRATTRRSFSPGSRST
jgi:hypothetical protein